MTSTRLREPASFSRWPVSGAILPGRPPWVASDQEKLLWDLVPGRGRYNYRWPAEIPGLPPRLSPSESCWRDGNRTGPCSPAYGI